MMQTTHVEFGFTAALVAVVALSLTVYTEVKMKTTELITEFGGAVRVGSWLLPSNAVMARA
jgi:hypothetical protein